MRTNNECTGYAAIFYHSLMPLNDRSDFKTKFGDATKSYMIDSPYWGSAVRIIIACGSLRVEGVCKSSIRNYMEERSQCDAYINMPMNLILAFVNGQAGFFSVVLRWVLGNVKIKGHFYLFGLLALFEFYRKSSRAIAGIR